MTIRITVRIQECEVRNPDSLDYRKSYQRILMKFYGELGCGLESRDQLITFRWRSASLSGSRSPFWITIRIFPVALQKSLSNSIMLAFGGGLCSLSTSSLVLKLSENESEPWLRRDEPVVVELSWSLLPITWLECVGAPDTWRNVNVHYFIPYLLNRLAAVQRTRIEWRYFRFDNIQDGGRWLEWRLVERRI